MFRTKIPIDALTNGLIDDIVSVVLYISFSNTVPRVPLVHLKLNEVDPKSSPWMLDQQ